MNDTNFETSHSESFLTHLSWRALNFISFDKEVSETQDFFASLKPSFSKPEIDFIFKKIQSNCQPIALSLIYHEKTSHLKMLINEGVFDENQVFQLLVEEWPRKSRIVLELYADNQDSRLLIDQPSTLHFEHFLILSRHDPQSWAQNAQLNAILVKKINLDSIGKIESNNFKRLIHHSVNAHSWVQHITQELLERSLEGSLKNPLTHRHLTQLFQNKHHTDIHIQVAHKCQHIDEIKFRLKDFFLYHCDQNANDTLKMLERFYEKHQAPDDFFIELLGEVHGRAANSIPPEAQAQFSILQDWVQDKIKQKAPHIKLSYAQVKDLIRQDTPENSERLLMREFTKSVGLDILNFIEELIFKQDQCLYSAPERKKELNLYFSYCLKTKTPIPAYCKPLLISEHPQLKSEIEAFFEKSSLELQIKHATQPPARYKI